MSSFTAITVGPGWTDIYAATGITVGTPLIIQPASLGVYLAISASEPTDEIGMRVPSTQELTVGGGNPGAWASSRGGTVTLYVQVNDSDAVRRMPFSDPRVIDGSKAFTVQPYTELNVKSGVQYYVRIAYPDDDTFGFGPIPAGATRKIHFQTGSKVLLAKLRIVEYVGEEFRIEIYSGPTGVTGGTPVTVSNWNSRNPVATTVTVTRDVTTTDDGTAVGDPEYLFGAQSTSGRDLNAIPQGRERVLPINSEFIVAITNTSNSASRLQYFLDWFEGDISTDIP